MKQWEKIREERNLMTDWLDERWKIVNTIEVLEKRGNVKIENGHKNTTITNATRDMMLMLVRYELIEFDTLGYDGWLERKGLCQQQDAE